MPKSPKEQGEIPQMLQKAGEAPVLLHELGTPAFWGPHNTMIKKLEQYRASRVGL